MSKLNVHFILFSDIALNHFLLLPMPPSNNANSVNAISEFSSVLSAFRWNRFGVKQSCYPLKHTNAPIVGIRK